MGTKDEGWTRCCRLKSPEGWLRGWDRELGGWRMVRTKFLGIERGTERFYPVPDPYLIRNASHDSSDLFPPFLGIIVYIYRSGLATLDAVTSCRATLRRAVATCILSLLGNSNDDIQGHHRDLRSTRFRQAVFPKAPDLCNS